MLSVSNISKSYSTPQGPLPVLQDISFELQPATFMAIVGESGSGKSTLLQIIGTLDQPDSGELTLNDQHLLDLPESKLASIRNRNIGFVYQAHHLIPELTAIENIMLPLLIQGAKEAQSREKGMELLKILGLENRAEHIPAHLSGGEAQRVAVARALITQPSLILADEPTGNLDENTANTVFSLMKKACKIHQVALIMVTHSTTFAHSCDTVYELSHQRLNKLQSKNS